MSDEEYDYSELIAIRTFGTHTDANVLAAVLHNAGIYAVVPLEHNVLSDIEVHFQGGMPVLIRPEDQERAEEAIAAARAAGDWMEQHPGSLPKEESDGDDDGS